jgi:hypothetical protein
MGSPCKYCGDSYLAHLAPVDRGPPCAPPRPFKPNALILLCYSGTPNMKNFQTLIDRGVAIRYLGDYKMTALVWACKRGLNDAAFALIRADGSSRHIRHKVNVIV